MKNKYLILLVISLTVCQAKAQWQSSVHLPNLNDWSSQAGFLEWYEHGNNTPNGQGYGNGIQMVLGHDNRFGSQIVIPTFDPQMYYRRNQAGIWDTWYTVWSSANLNKLDVDFNARNLTTNGIIQTYNRSNSGATWDNLKLWSEGETSYLESSGDEKGLVIRSNTGNKILLMSKVAIGTEDPKDYKLAVAGPMIAESVKVALQPNWPDYVFHSSYKLPDLKATEQFIKQNKHLPEIPSAAEVEKNGINLGDMNSKLLKKIEELTLHLIEINKKLETQDETNTDLRKEIEQLKSKNQLYE